MMSDTDNRAHQISCMVNRGFTSQADGPDKALAPGLDHCTESSILHSWSYHITDGAMSRRRYGTASLSVFSRKPFAALHSSHGPPDSQSSMRDCYFPGLQVMRAKLCWRALSHVVRIERKRMCRALVRSCSRCPCLGVR